MIPALIKSLDVDVVTTPIVIEPRADIAKAKAVIADNHAADFFIPLILSWLEAPNVLDTLQEVLHKPLLLWSHTMWKEDDELKSIPVVAVTADCIRTSERAGQRR